MTHNLKFTLLFEDRIGIVLDIARLMVEQSLNIVSMEVEQKDGFAKVSVEIEKTGEEEIDKDALLQLFTTLPKFESKAELERLPQEKRERWFRTLFDGMSEGVMSVDADGIINAANSVACRILGQTYEYIINTHVLESNPKDCVLVECFEKQIPVNKRRSVVTNTGRVEFYGSAKPIRDSQGNFLGAVLVMKNLREVKEMVDAVLAPLEITFDDFIGQSPGVKNLIAFAKKIATVGTIVSIAGESGTGKELFAKALHFESGREGPFIPINCAALPEPLIESELFGYVDGAFTGAKRKGKAGLFEAAKNGTIFLDEIGEMPPGPQAKILRVLQDGMVRRIGGIDEIPVNAWIITATNRDLKEMVEEGTFREDLFYRINVLTAHIPPLRERLVDIPLLVDKFLQQFNQRLGRNNQSISSGALEKLINYDWPGNVRELQNVIERAAILSESNEIREDAIFLNSGTRNGENSSLPVQPPSDDAMRGLRDLVRDYETGILLKVLNSTPSIRKAAKHLGISHTALLKKMEKYKLSIGSKSDQWHKNRPA